MLHPARAQITKELGNVFAGQRLASFEFNNQTVFHKQIGNIFTQDRPVFVVNFQRDLLFSFDSGLTQPVCQAIFINLFKMAVTQEAV